MYPLCSFKLLAIAFAISCATIGSVKALPLDSSSSESLTARGDITNYHTDATDTWTLGKYCTFELSYGEINVMSDTTQYKTESYDNINDDTAIWPYEAQMISLDDTKGVVIVPTVNSVRFHAKTQKGLAWDTSGVVDMFTVLPQNVEDSIANPIAFNMSSSGVPIQFQVGDEKWTSPQPKACTGNKEQDKPTLGDDPEHDMSVSCVESSTNAYYSPKFTVKGKWFCTGSGTAG